MCSDIAGVLYWQVGWHFVYNIPVVSETLLQIRHQKLDRELQFNSRLLDADETVLSPPYNTLKVDVWSLGATVWEMAEAEPPFADTQQVEDRWPPLSQPAIYSPAFHDFLRQCSEPSASRPTPSELRKVR